uniref:Uncharacterized protein n=1 Tax=Chromera velia CCMP2878 TaxID=1169474 RepID=A0A0G4G715_9ALVE|mmetsp:Transcript_23241/g.45719  ORF Transcript_23241/g.45719 Transcript_23241/m.45719 type:complete len:983 (+) Transcript_23241:110-3058(+)|eukprot:Cvel_20555.t1-p1 / transcript=Cvel_20555.t1 / gene=Cvel_20555 / organism=Chromera_velia_CCMP2878 / gene_product=hypothetical protein / transcript_product=hypothetical protein / location=Cvel_scaffold1855:11141-20687(+) / protein_length=982 / sequence_SO=supercontig / SO=protein_coding / is_pseudo=false
MSGNRSFQLELVNFTTIDLYRYSHSVRNGEWVLCPCQRIKSGEKVTISATALSALGNFKGKVEYGVMVGGTIYVCLCEFIIPMLAENQVQFTWRKVKSQMTVSAALDMPEASSMFAIRVRARGRPTQSEVYKYELTVYETESGPRCIKAMKLETSQYVEKWGHFPKEALSQEEHARVATGALSRERAGSTGAAQRELLVKQSKLASTKIANFPKSFLPVGIKEWTRYLRGSLRSCLFKIVNLTRYPLLLDTGHAGGRRRTTDRQAGEFLPPLCLSLTDGIYAEFPPEELLPFEIGEFGVYCTGFMKGTEGSITYVPEGARNSPPIVLSWSHPYIGTFSAGGNCPRNQLEVFVSTDALNECTCIFRILDPSRPPPIQLMKAFTIAQPKERDRERTGTGPTNTMSSGARGGGKDGSPLHSQPSMLLGGPAAAQPGAERQLRQAEREGMDVLPMLAQAVQEQARNTAAERLPQRRKRPFLDLDSPRAFLSSAMQKQAQLARGTRSFHVSTAHTSSSPFASLPGSAQLVLQWRIGPEVFTKRWTLDEPLRLFPARPGGLETPSGTPPSPFSSPESIHKILMLAGSVSRDQRYIERQLRIDPLSLDLAADMLSGSGGGEGGHGRDSAMPTEAALMDAIYFSLNTLAKGLRPVIARNMSQKFGAHWARNCGIPRGHWWYEPKPGPPKERKDDSDYQLDAEGALLVMHSNWEKTFSKEIDSPQILHQLQAVAIHWATLDRSKFDAHFVHAVMESAIELLQGVGTSQEHVVALRQYRDSVFGESWGAGYDTAGPSPAASHTASGSTSIFPASSTTGGGGAAAASGGPRAVLSDHAGTLSSRSGQGQQRQTAGGTQPGGDPRNLRTGSHSSSSGGGVLTASGGHFDHQPGGERRVARPQPPPPPLPPESGRGGAQGAPVAGRRMEAPPSSSANLGASRGAVSQPARDPTPPSSHVQGGRPSSSGSSGQPEQSISWSGKGSRRITALDDFLG